MDIVAVVITGLNDTYVRFGNGRFLLEFLLKEAVDQSEVTVEQPADNTECKHIAALQHGLVVHSCICQTLLYHLRYRAGYDAVGVDTHLAQIVITAELGLLKVARTEGVGVNDDGSVGFAMLVLHLQCCRIHCNKHVAAVARRIDFSCTDMHLETAHTCQ